MKTNLYTLHACAMVELTQLAHGQQTFLSATRAVSLFQAESQRRESTAEYMRPLMHASNLLACINGVHDAQTARAARFEAAQFLADQKR